MFSYFLVFFKLKRAAGKLAVLLTKNRWFVCYFFVCFFGFSSLKNFRWNSALVNVLCTCPGKLGLIFTLPAFMERQFFLAATIFATTCPSCKLTWVGQVTIVPVKAVLPFSSLIAAYPLMLLLFFFIKHFV